MKTKHLTQLAGLLLIGCQSAMASNAPTLSPVPPDGLQTLDEPAVLYYQQMGPLEYATHALPPPTYPAWRIHYTLHPTMDEKDNTVLSGYQVNADRINLSQLVYQEIVSAYGKDAADPALNNKTPHDSHLLPFIVVQNTAADLLAEDVSNTPLSAPDKPCGLQPDCGQTWRDSEGDWGSPDTIKLEPSPWKTQSQLPQLLRAMAKQAGWLQKNGPSYQWVTPEQPEGRNDKKTWVEITVDNYPGNGGMFLADWVESVMDDSISAKVIRIIQDPTTPTQAMVYSAYICGRGNNTNKIAQQCS